MIITMGLIEVEVVGLQPAQRGVNRIKYMLAGEAAVIGTSIRREIDLGEDLDRLTANAAQRPPKHFFRFGSGIHISCIERRNSRVQGRADALSGYLVIDLCTVRKPVTIHDLAYFQTTGTETTVFHDFYFSAL